MTVEWDQDWPGWNKKSGTNLKTFILIKWTKVWAGPIWSECSIYLFLCSLFIRADSARLYRSSVTHCDCDINICQGPGPVQKKILMYVERCQLYNVPISSGEIKTLWTTMRCWPIIWSTINMIYTDRYNPPPPLPQSTKFLFRIQQIGFFSRKLLVVIMKVEG